MNFFSFVLPVTLLDFTGGGTPNPVANTTSQDERWHFYWDSPTLMLNYAETTQFCSRIPGGHLSIIYDKNENNRIQQHALVRLIINFELIRILYKLRRL